MQLVGDVLLDGMRGGPRIRRHGGLSGFVFLFPPMPARIAHRGLFGGEPGGKAFIQPGVVPPTHGHQVPEPLVGHLVSLNAKNRLPVLHRAGGADQQHPVVISNRPPILHGTGKTTRHGNGIELRQGIGIAEIIVVVGQNILGAGERHRAVLFVTRRCPDAELRAAAHCRHFAQIPAEIPPGRMASSGIAESSRSLIGRGQCGGDRHVSHRGPGLGYRDGEVKSRTK